MISQGSGLSLNPMSIICDINIEFLTHEKRACENRLRVFSINTYTSRDRTSSQETMNGCLNRVAGVQSWQRKTRTMTKKE